MSTLLRYLNDPVLEDLAKKMVFLGGPRQVGKTTFAQGLIHNFKRGHPAYLNWDLPEHKKSILAGVWPPKEKPIILDEIHKYHKWRNLIKGHWDVNKDMQQFLVTGSARLDYYSRGGDSLLGRYHYYRLHPLSLAEIQSNNLKVGLQHLLFFGGFPEPFLEGTEKSLRKWHSHRVHRIVSEDIRDLENIKEISLLELLIHALPERVGSPLSRKNLAQELEVDFKTVERWLSILERVYYCFRVSPFGAPKIRAVKKEQKLYLWDWSEHSDSGKRWENFVASQLLKYCHHQEDVEGYRMELRFLRDADGREVDFVVLKNKQPVFAVECKSGESALSPHIQYFQDRTSIPKFYQVHSGKKHFRASPRAEVIPYHEFCSAERLP